MKRLLSASIILAAFAAAMMSCGPPLAPHDQDQLATKRQALTSPMLISSLPDANRTGIYFRPESTASIRNWPTHSLYLNSLTEWVKDHQFAFQVNYYCPFFYRAEFFFDANEMWQVMTRSNTADTAELGVYDKGARHEAEDWNRYGSDPALIASSGSGGAYDNKAPLISPCSGKIFHKGFSSAGFGNQVYVLCKFRASWRTKASGFDTIEDGYEFLAYKTSHLSEMTTKAVGDTVTLGEFIGKVGTSGTTAYHLHNAFHRENMLMRCDQSGKANSTGDYICTRTFNGADTVNIWPTTRMAGNDRGFSFIRDHYYDPLEFIKARSGNLIYSKLLNASHANNGILIANHGIGPVQEPQTLVITLNNRDYPQRGTTDKPPFTKITIFNATGAKQVFAGAENWSDQDRRVVLRNVQPGWSYRLRLEIKNRDDGATTLSSARFQFYITSFPNSNPTLGHYGNKSTYPVLPRRSGLGTNVGMIYLNHRSSSSDTSRNMMTLFNYLKISHDHALLTCESRYNCDYNRFLTRCEAAKKLATFMNYGYDSRKENPFTDLKPDHSCYPAAQTLYYEKVITSSTKPFAFNPNAQIDRATAIAMIVRALYGEPSKTLPSRFSDVPQNSWYNPYFTKAKDEKLIDLGNSGQAKPGAKVPEAHFLIMLMRAMGMDDNSSTILTYTTANNGQLTERDGVGGGYCSGCACTTGQKAKCGQSAGSCQEGYYECVDGKWDTTTCKGEVQPKPEECNGIDDDCDGAVDNISGTTNALTRDCELPDCGTKGKQTCQQGQWSTCSAKACTLGPKCTDNDKDGYGDGPDCIAKDCNDQDPLVNPRQVEICNGKDDDCDGQIDNIGKPVSDGGLGGNARGCYSAPCGNPGKQLCQNGQWTTCDAPKCPDPCIDKDLDGYFANASTHCPGPADCDDTDPNIHPGAEEDCNGKDDNCDGHIDNNAQGDATPLTMYCYKPPCGKKVPITCTAGKWGMCELQKCPDCIDKDGDGFKVGGAQCGPPDCDDTRKDIHQGAPELCNGKDDDCDGKIDNLSGSDTSITRPCSLACGAQGTQTCESIAGKSAWSVCKGGCIPCEDKDNDGANTGSPSCSPIDCDGNDPKVYPGAQELCDGKDNDCDGMIDNIGGSKDALQKVCTNPQCGSKGTQTCTASQSGSPTWSTCSAVCKCEDKDKDGFKIGGAHCGLIDCDDNDPSKNPFNLESCDGKDNDCNGKVDDGVSCNCQKGQTRSCYSGPSGTANKGTCREGTQTCIEDGQGGTAWTPCKGEVKPTAEICNGLDDDCDGQLDNGVTCGCKPGETRSCGSTTVGECKAGTQTCTALGNWSLCTGAITASPELCDGKDNDCDGQVDENLTKPCYTGPAAQAGVGICKHGYQKCIAGKWDSACYNEIKPLQEQCDGADNDCDGQVDENLTQSCYTGPTGTGGYGQCKKGTQTCAAGKWGNCTGEGRPSPETCDGIDNDCDGLIDNKAGTNQRLTRSCTRQPCGYKGLEMCKTGQWITSLCSAPQCPVANCTDKDGDGYDGTGTGTNCHADCNDSDPQVHPGKIEFCDGKDNDCDGKIDVDSSGKPVTQFCSVQCKDGSQQAGTKTCDIKTGQLGPCVQASPCPVCEDQDKDGYGKNGAADCRFPGIKDCDDTDAARRPDGVEICDGKDNDCDGQIDNQKGSSLPITKNCTVSPCGNPGKQKCLNGQWDSYCDAQPCVYCGNGTCQAPTEHCGNCFADCACPSDKYCDTSQSAPVCVSKCGNGKNDFGENCLNCPQDVKCFGSRICDSQGMCVMPPSTCGNGSCDSGEDCSTCAADCKCSTGTSCSGGKCVSSGGCTNCSSSQVCYNNACCTPSCGSLSCGSNNCGGTCQCPSGYQCLSGVCEQPRICGNGTCESGENCSSCQADCGCTSPYSCNSSGQCVLTCNCNSKQYCDNGTCKDLFTLSTTSETCYTTSGTTICLKLQYNGGTSFTATVRKTTAWSGSQIKLMIYNPERWFCCSQCKSDFSNSTLTPTGTSNITKTFDISCMTVGETMPIHAEILSPPTCTSCSYHSGAVRITRNK